jgi:hypothetical protein
MPSQGGELSVQTGVLRSGGVIPQTVLTPQESSQKRPCTVLSSRGGRSHELCLLQRLRIPTGYDGELPSCENSARAGCRTSRAVSRPIRYRSTWASTTHAAAGRVISIIVYLCGDGNHRDVDGTSAMRASVPCGRGMVRTFTGKSVEKVGATRQVAPTPSPVFPDPHQAALPSYQVPATMYDESTVEVEYHAGSRGFEDVRL